MRVLDQKLLPLSGKVTLTKPDLILVTTLWVRNTLETFFLFWSWILWEITVESLPNPLAKMFQLLQQPNVQVP